MASTPNEAIQILTRRGISVQSIRAVDQTPVARPTTAPPVALRVRAPRGLPRVPWSAKRHYFVFNQLAASVRAGVSMGQSLRTLANSALKPWELTMVSTWADRTEGGESLHVALATCVPPIARSTVGMVRVGELAGAVPEALGRVAEQHHANIKFDRAFWLMRALFYYGALSLPISIAAMKGFTDAFSAYEADGGGNVTAMVFQHIGQLILWPFGPLTLALWLILSLTARLLMRPAFETFRHWFAYVHPYMRGRARVEGIKHFCWALQRLSQAGLAPYSAWNAAAEAIPNAIVREKILDIGRAAREQTKFAELFSRSSLFPSDYVNIIQNGEFTGTVPSALEMLTDAADGDFSSKTKQSVGIWMVSTMFVMAIIGLATATIFAYYWYNVFYGRVLSGLDATIIFRIQG